jgi:hypothetical protein
MAGLTGRMARSNKIQDLQPSTIAALEQGLSLQIANKGQKEALAGISTGMTAFQEEKTSLLDDFAAAGVTPPPELAQQFDDLQAVREQQLVFGSIDQGVASQLTGAINPRQLEANELEIRNNIAQLSAGIRQEDKIITRNDRISKMRKNLADAVGSELDNEFQISENTLKGIEARNAELRTRIDDRYGALSTDDLDGVLQSGSYLSLGISPGVMYRYVNERAGLDIDQKIKEMNLAKSSKLYEKTKFELEKLEKDKRLAGMLDKPRDVLQAHADEARDRGFTIIDGEKVNQVEVQKRLNIIDNSTTLERGFRVKAGLQAEKAGRIFQSITDIGTEIADYTGTSPEIVIEPMIKDYAKRIAQVDEDARRLFPNDRLGQSKYKADTLESVVLTTDQELIKIQATAQRFAVEPLLAAKKHLDFNERLNVEHAFSSLVENRHTLARISSSDMYHPASLQVLKVMDGVNDGENLNGNAAGSEANGLSENNKSLLARFGGKSTGDKALTAKQQRQENARRAKEYQERFTDEQREKLTDDLTGALAQRGFKTALSASLEQLKDSQVVGDKETYKKLLEGVMQERNVNGAVIPRTSNGYAINSVNLSKERKQQINWSIALDNIYTSFDDESRADEFVDELVENYKNAIPETVRLSLPRTFQQHQIASLAMPTDHPLMTYESFYEAALDSDLLDLQTARKNRSSTEHISTEQTVGVVTGFSSTGMPRFDAITANGRESRRQQIIGQGDRLRSIRERE